jgi:hypothetical protein
MAIDWNEVSYDGTPGLALPPVSERSKRLIKVFDQFSSQELTIAYSGTYGTASDRDRASLVIFYDPKVRRRGRGRVRIVLKEHQYLKGDVSEWTRSDVSFESFPPVSKDQVDDVIISGLGFVSDGHVPSDDDDPSPPGDGDEDLFPWAIVKATMPNGVKYILLDPWKEVQSDNLCDLVRYILLTEVRSHEYREQLICNAL